MREIEKWAVKAWAEMKTHGITQTELAKHLGVTDRYVSMIMHGKKKPKGIKERINFAIEELKQKGE